MPLKLQYKSIHISLKEDISDDIIFVTGFKGFGAIGLITVHHLVRKLEMRRIGFITARIMPEFSYADRNGFGGPFELYYNNEHKILALLNRELPPVNIRVDFAKALAKLLAETIRLKYAILIGGLDKRFKEEGVDIKLAYSSTYRGPKLEDKLMEEWLYVIGPLALLMIAFEEYGLPSILLLPYSEIDRPDPIGAAVAIQRISKLIGVKIDVSELYEESKRIEQEYARIEEMRREYGEETRGQAYM